MIFKTISHILLLLLVNQTLQLPDCKTLYYYFCPYNSYKSLPKEAVPGYDKNGMSFPVPYVKDDWFQVPNGNAKSERVLCSNDKSAFQWKSYVPTEVDLSEPLRDIDMQRMLVIDGRTVKFLNMKNGKQTEYVYLEFNCLLNEKERIPKILDSPIFKWENYISEVPQHAIEGGVDSPQSKSSFYIGLTTYKGEAYLAKIVQKTTWLVIATSKSETLYITFARDVKILCANNVENLIWKLVIPDEEMNTTTTSKIYRCQRKNEYVVTGNPNNCVGFPTEKLSYDEEALYLVENS